ncbi:MAG: SMP-30/gluconolactonase/LRE family protein [Ignavibacteriales bacterium]|nr:SMP-30/gluconolactonase/LRE family protein [Ignavibacteriales bacterium]
MKYPVLFAGLFLLCVTPLIPQSLDAMEVVEDEWQIIAENCDFPEGPAFDGQRNLYFSNCYGRWIAKWDGETTTVFLDFKHDTSVVNRTNGLAFKDGFLYACEYGNGSIVKIDEHANAEILASGFRGVRFNRPNDLVFDKNGMLWFSDPKSYNREILDGRLFRLDPESGEVELMFSGLGFPNGLNFSPDGKYLYLSESAFQRVLKFEMRADGTLAAPKVLVELPGGDPDGIEVDQESNLYIAHFGGKAIYKVSPEGELLIKFSTPGKKPSNVELIKGRLFITECERNKLYSIQTK